MGWPHIITEYGTVAQNLLPKVDDDKCNQYDAIVVGSGMGGGVVAASLADEKKRVLVLEAGSLLFPTHVGNMPRPIRIGNFEKVRIHGPYVAQIKLTITAHMVSIRKV